jgi:hypothetical protein
VLGASHNLKVPAVVIPLIAVLMVHDFITKKFSADEVLNDGPVLKNMSPAHQDPFVSVFIKGHPTFPGMVSLSIFRAERDAVPMLRYYAARARALFTHALPYVSYTRMETVSANETCLLDSRRSPAHA